MKIILYCFVCLAPFASQAQQLLSNPTFEGSFNSGLAANWTKAPDSGVTMTCAPETNIVHGGSYSQNITVSGLSGTKQALFQQGFNSKDGRVYNGSVWLRAATPCQVTFLLRLGTQRAVGIHTITVDTNWQQVVSNGGWKSGGSCSFIISFLNNGTYWVDDASLTDVTSTYLNAPLANTNVTVPATFFGMTINHNNTAANWPPLQQGVIRLWDTGTRWSQIQISNSPSFSWTSDSSFSWAHMDQWVGTITNSNPNCKIIYTMGQTPAWAASAETSAPSNMNTWSNYVFHVATHYKGVIRYYELWNEVDSPSYYKGAITSVVTMAQIAKSVLTNIDSQNKLIGPAVTLGGFDWLQQFIAAGGGQYQDIVTYHDYPTYIPENSLAGVIGLQDTLSQFPQVNSLPIWCTEGNPDTIQTGATTAQNQGIATRAYLYLWTQNVQNFCWYCWDMSNVGGLNKPPLQSGSAPSTTPAPAGVAYRTLVSWLVGAKMLSKTIDANGSWAVQVQQPGQASGYIVWNPNSNAVFNIPASWNIYQQRDLSNNVSSLSATNLTAGVTPVMLVSQSNSPTAITLSPAALPEGTVGASYIQITSASGGTAPYTYAVTSGSLPPGFRLFSSGVLSGTPANPFDSTFTITATDALGGTGANRYTLTADCPAITLTPATLPPASLGVAYNQPFAALGGAAPYSFALTSGNLPPGLTLSDSGLLSGIPTNSGDFPVTITATDAYSCDGSQDFTLSLAGPPVILAQPQSQTVPAGNDATLTVVTTGSPAPAFQWFLNSLPVTGAVGPSLTLANFQSANEGAYSVLVTNQLGTALSQTAALYLAGPLRFESPWVDSHGGFSAWLVGPAGTNFAVAASTDLLTWTSLTTNPVPSGILNFTDTNQNGPLPSARFYRGRLSP
jgi:hypothetical protein